MSGWIKRARSRDERGAAAVEFALISIILLTLLIGIIQASIFFWSYQTGANAAREGARQYAVDPCDKTGLANDQKVKDFVGGAASGTVTVGHTFSGSNPPVTGDEVTVTVSYDAPSIGGLLPDFPAVVKTASARVEDVQDCTP
ncbi:pilus assembly protein [Nocardioides sp. JQ2195]|uniref:TadE/TadG family type IV pilus assembly protein n=1 Tax=Nocardioides sp. JQ2195 TaxID=2592334 RepID=UPI00143ED739|nr:TadE/TadG family type IV pilus assembly protein [Nocardioides sp. JQ2195]QIX27819.1 pilus assembly protein [Nocardioides sp. JQ2195]